MNLEGGHNMRNRAALRKEQPPVVKRAIAEGDTKLLSKLGQKGGIQASDNREARKAFDQHLAKKRDAEEEQRHIEANEHIVPIDSDDERDEV